MLGKYCDLGADVLTRRTIGCSTNACCAACSLRGTAAQCRCAHRRIRVVARHDRHQARGGRARVRTCLSTCRPSSRTLPLSSFMCALVRVVRANAGLHCACSAAPLGNHSVIPFRSASSRAAVPYCVRNLGESVCCPRGTGHTSIGYRRHLGTPDAAYARPERASLKSECSERRTEHSRRPTSRDDSRHEVPPWGGASCSTSQSSAPVRHGESAKQEADSRARRACSGPGHDPLPSRPAGR